MRGNGVETSFKVADPVITEEKRTKFQDSRAKEQVIKESKERPEKAKAGPAENRTAEFQLSDVTVNRIFGENPYATNTFNSTTNTYKSNHLLSTNTHVEATNGNDKEKPKEAHAGNLSHVSNQNYGQ